MIHMTDNEIVIILGIFALSNALIVYGILIFLYWIYRKDDKDITNPNKLILDDHFDIELEEKMNKKVNRLIVTFFVFIMFIIILWGLHSNNYIGTFSLLSLIISAATLIYIWCDGKKRDSQHRESIQAMNTRLHYIWRDGKKRDLQHREIIQEMHKRLQYIENIERRNTMQNIISAAAESIFCKRKRNVEHGVKVFEAKGMSQRGCITKWDLFYESEANKYRNQIFGSIFIRKSHTYTFRVLIVLKSLEELKEFSIGNNKYDIPRHYFHRFDRENLQNYEIRISKFEGKYGIFSEHGYQSVTSMCPNSFGAICNAIGCIQNLDDEELGECRERAEDIGYVY